MSIWIKGDGGPWTMADESAFIANIGVRTDHNSHTPLTVAGKLALLRGYREGILRRDIWTNLNQQTLLAQVDSEIARLSLLKPTIVL